MENQSRTLAGLGRVIERGDLAYSEAPAVLSGGFFTENHAFQLADVPPPWNGPMVVRLFCVRDRRRVPIQARCAWPQFRQTIRLAGDGRVPESPAEPVRPGGGPHNSDRERAARGHRTVRRSGSNGAGRLIAIQQLGEGSK